MGGGGGRLAIVGDTQRRRFQGAVDEWVRGGGLRRTGSVWFGIGRGHWIGVRVELWRVRLA